MRRYKVRFHLGKGENYMKWQVFDLKHNHKDYYNPEKVSLVMSGCELGNHPKTAQRIYQGGNKTVCAWVSCDEVRVSTTNDLRGNVSRYMYNPKKNPHWYTDTNKNVDGRKIKQMFTIKNKIYG